MVNQITDGPNEYDFGLEFDYALWTPNTRIDLVNVPWNNDYRDVVKFANNAELDRYIDSRAPAGITIDRVSYIKPNEPVRVNIPHNRAIRYNYLRANNPIQPIPGNDEHKNYYYFILDVRYVAPNTTELILQLDVWATYVNDAIFGNCYVERGHIGIANENAFDSYGRDYLTVPEGFDVGSEYQTIHVYREYILTPFWELAQEERFPGHDIVVVTTTDFFADPGTPAAPKLNTARGSVFQGTMHGADIRIFNRNQFDWFLSEFKDKPWVTQGIISITMIPPIKRYHPEFEHGDDTEPGTMAPAYHPLILGHDTVPNWRDASVIVDNIPERYRHLDKFKTSPYMMIQLTSNTGAPIALKPESWNDPNAKIAERASLVPPHQRVEFMPRFYNSKISDENQAEILYPGADWPLNGTRGDDLGEYVDLSVQIANFPTMAIVNNGAIAYLAANVHGIGYQRNSASWTQQRALGSNAAQYDVATGGIHLAQSLAGVQGNADIEQTANVNRTLLAQGIVGAAGSVVQGVGNAVSLAGSGTPLAAPGALMAGVAQASQQLLQSGIQQGANSEAQNIRGTALGLTTIYNDKQSRLVRDTNKSVADWAARGDYANQIAGINAKVQDANMIQPTTSGQINGETMNIVNGGLQYALRWRMIDQAAIRTIGEYWLRYGYAIRSFIRMPESLMAMDKFTYWKLSEAYIASATMPEGFKQALRGIFEKGVTVWANPNDIGQIDIADNRPLEGISY